MTVSFHSPYMDVAVELFQDAFTKDKGPIQTSFTGTQVHFFFPDDTFVRDVRAWCADAFGCGLIFSPAISVY